VGDIKALGLVFGTTHGDHAGAGQLALVAARRSARVTGIDIATNAYYIAQSNDPS
jgi:hypothetical protein